MFSARMDNVKTEHAFVRKDGMESIVQSRDVPRGKTIECFYNDQTKRFFP